MSEVARLAKEAASSRDFARAYLAYVGDVLARLDAEAVAAFIEELEAARREGHTVFIAGNGGSAATASHMAADLAFGTRAAAGTASLRALALTDNVALMTAIGNDEGYADLFVHQLHIHYRPGDALVCISASGNSPNVLAAAAWVRARGGRVIGLVGFDGGELKGQCDIVIHASTPRGDYGPVEDAHLVVDHLVTAWLMHHARSERG